MSYGYNSNIIFTSAVTDINVEAGMLLDRLDQERESKEQRTRPIIFVAHSLGGIVVKKALVLAHERSKHYADLLECVKGCLFLGVPHRGANSAYWAKFAADLLSIPQLGFHGNSKFLNALKSNSPTLADISQQFIERSSQLKIRTFWETEKVGNQLIVSKDSACLNIDNEMAVGLANANHVNMCKFADAASQKYSPVWKALKGMIIDSAVLARVPSPVCPAAPVPLSAKEKDKEDECLQHLYTSNYSSFLKRTPEWEPGTCQWFLEHQRYWDWRQEKTSSLLWVSADPGCGKSVMARFLVHELQSKESQSTLPGTVCHFFFKDDNKKQKSASSAICALLHQLFDSNRAMIKHAIREFSLKGKSLIEELDTLWEILITASTAPGSENIICVIDALDECEESARAQLVDLLIGFYKRRPTLHTDGAMLKMIITSRPYHAIEQQFYIHPTIRLRVEDETEALSADIEVVINGSIDKLGEHWDLPDKVQDQLKLRLIKKADRTFLWVSLILQMLLSTPKPSESEFNGILENLPQDLNATYEKILGQSSNPDYARRILHIVVAAARPLTLKEMNIALAIRPGHRSMEDLQPNLMFNPQTTLKTICGLFLRVIDSKVYLVHQTAKEFLTIISNGDPGAWRHSLDLVDSNRVLSEICVSYLSLEVFESHGRFVLDDQAFRLKRKSTINQYMTSHCFLDYAAKHWVFHFRAAKIPDGSPLVKPARDLCVPSSQRILIWFWVCYDPYRNSKSYPNTSTELTIASHFGLEVIVTAILRGGGSITAQEEEGWAASHAAASRSDKTALHVAASCGFEGIVSRLLVAGAIVETQDYAHKTALHVAVSGGFEGVVSRLLTAGADVDTQDYTQQTALYVAASCGFEDVVSRLLVAGANVDTQDFTQKTALHVAASRGFEGVVSRLLTAGADVKLQSLAGRTVLHEAALGGFEDIVSRLLAAGADIDAKTHSGQTALHQAAEYGSETIVQLLLQYGAYINVQDKYRNTPLNLAAAYRRAEMIELLLAEGAALGIERYPSQRTLLNAAFCGLEVEVRQLLCDGVDINVHGKKMQTALHVAVLGKKKIMVKLLLDEGALVDASDSSKETALHFAVSLDEESMVLLLLQYGASVDITDQWGDTALQLAQSCGYESITRVLESHMEELEKNRNQSLESRVLSPGLNSAATPDVESEAEVSSLNASRQQSQILNQNQSSPLCHNHVLDPRPNNAMGLSTRQLEGHQDATIDLGLANLRV